MSESPGSSGPPGPIGVYDSGIGGISVLAALRERLLGEHFVYVADSANAPYGERDRTFISARAGQIVEFLIQQKCRAVVLACNTVSAVAAASLRERYRLPIVAMEPAIKPAAAATRSKVVLVLGTETTIESAGVARLRRQHGANARIILQACPGLAARVERGALDDPMTVALLRQYIEPALAEHADTIVLGCTHYVFLIRAIRTIAGPHVAIIEPSKAIAEQVARVIAPAAARVPAKTVFFTSGSVDALRLRLSEMWTRDAEVCSLATAVLSDKKKG
jgi:glutamate racemase